MEHAGALLDTVSGLVHSAGCTASQDAGCQGRQQRGLFREAAKCGDWRTNLRSASQEVRDWGIDRRANRAVWAP